MVALPAFDQIPVSVAAAVATGGTILVPYPTGKGAGSYTTEGARLSLPGFQTVYASDSGRISVALRATGALVTLVSVPPLPVGASGLLDLQLRVPDADSPASINDAIKIAQSPAPLIAFDGDSLIENTILASTATSTLLSMRGLPCALPAVTGQRVQTRPDLIFGKSGENSTSILTRIAATLACDAPILFVPTTSNDFLASATRTDLNTAVSNWTEYWDRARAAGKEVWTTPPWAKQQTTQQARDLMFEFSQWVLAQETERRNFKVFDVNHLFADPLSADYSPRTNYAIDSNPALHPQALGMLMSIGPIRDYVNARFPAPAPRMISVADAYSANNLSGNLLTNGLLEGTSGGSTGTASTVTGSGTAIAANWNITTVAQSGGNLASLTTTASKVAGSDGYSGQRVTLGGSFTGNSTTGSLVRLMQTFTAPQLANLAIADLTQGECDVELSAAAAQCLAGFALTYRATVNGTQQIVVDGYCTPSDILPSTAQTFRLRTPLYRRDGVTPSINLTHVPTAVDFGLWAYLRSGAQTADVAFDIKRMSLRKVV